MIINPQICIEGPDKVGKDSLLLYIHELTNYQYCINVRGILSQLVYNDKFNRNNEYEIPYKPLIILLTANEIDQEIRCKLTNESKIDFNKDMKAFSEYAKYLNENNYAVVWEYDTSDNTLIQIATDIKEKLKSIKIESFINNSKNVVSSLNLYSKEGI